MSWLPALPIIIPLAAAALGLLNLRQARAQRAIGVAGAAALFAAAVALFEAVRRYGVISVQIGNWPAPYGVTLTCDLLSAVMVLLAGTMALLTTVYSVATIDDRLTRLGYYPLVNALLMGVCGAFLTGDIFNLFVWFEVMLLASFVLMAIGGGRAQSEGAVKYVTINLIASIFFLTAVGVLYGKTGTLNMADLARAVAAEPSETVFTAVALLFVASFGIKAAAFPLFFWLPASYHTAPPAVAALFSGLLTKAGVYALIRVTTLLFTQEPDALRAVLAPMAAATMIAGVLGAIAQTDIRRLLAFHIVSQIGYLLLAVAIGTPLALASAAFFMVHVVTAKAALFLVAGLIRRETGTYDLKAMGGLYGRRPWLALLFLVSALSLAGIPPFGGFFAKLGLVRAAIEEEQGLLTTAALAVSLLTLYSMVKIWNEAFWKAAPADSPVEAQGYASASAALVYGPVIALAAVGVALGVWAGPAFDLSLEAARQMTDQSHAAAAIVEPAP